MRVAALCLFLAGLVNGVAHADDYGPHPALRAIRGAVPVLLAARLKALNAGAPVSVSDVVVVGPSAIAAWNAGTSHGLVAFVTHPNGWWMTAEANQTPTKLWTYDGAGSLPNACESGDAIGPTSEALEHRMSVPPEAAAIAAAHIPEIADADARSSADGAHHHKNGVPPARCTADGGTTRALEADSAGYLTSWKAPADRQFPLSVTLHPRAPTNAEMWPTPSADAIYYVSFESPPGSTLYFAPNSRLDVWCPFVLDSSLRYTLTIADVLPFVGPLAGTVSDNTMHFTLPAFTAPPATEAMAEVDGDTFSPQYP